LSLEKTPWIELPPAQTSRSQLIRYDKSLVADGGGQQVKIKLFTIHLINEINASGVFHDKAAFSLK
jgi:hypothetical protein